MTMYSALVLPGDGSASTIPSTFVRMQFTPTGFNPLSTDPTLRTSYWVDTAGTLTHDDVLVLLNGLDAFRTSQVTAVEVSYQAALQAPVSYLGTTFPADLQSQIILCHAMVVYGKIGATPEGFYFTDTSRNKVSMTLAQLEELGEAVATAYLPVFQKWESLQDQIAAATTLAEIQAVNW